MNRQRIALVSGTAFAGLALLAACGTGSYDSPAPAANTPTSSVSQPASQAGLLTASNSQFGQLVTTADGKTLYRFDKDKANPSVSNCDGACAQLWPPVLASDNTLKAQGIDQSLLGTVVRKDGTKQVTLKGWPLYQYTPDTKAGDVKGQGVGGTWFAVTPNGQKAAAQSTSSSSGSVGSGY